MELVIPASILPLYSDSTVEYTNRGIELEESATRFAIREWLEKHNSSIVLGVSNIQGVDRSLQRKLVRMRQKFLLHKAYKFIGLPNVNKLFSLRKTSSLVFLYFCVPII